MGSSDSFFRQLSSKEAWKSTSKRWGGAAASGGGEFVMKKRVMVVVDQSSESKHAMMWALTHVTNKGDILTLLHVVSPSCNNSDYYSSSSSCLASSLGSLCKACKPEVSLSSLSLSHCSVTFLKDKLQKLYLSLPLIALRGPVLRLLLGWLK
ncbi:hypothetical protein ACS0TY_036849 [Phlomoides rotata]